MEALAGPNERNDPASSAAGSFHDAGREVICPAIAVFGG